MDKSGFYILEDESYEYVCGGNILFGGGINVKNKVSRLEIAVSKVSNKINTKIDNDSVSIDETIPKTYVYFHSKDSVESLIGMLNAIKERMTW